MRGWPMKAFAGDTAVLVRAAREASEIEHARRIALEEAAAAVVASRKGPAVVSQARLDELAAVLLDEGGPGE